MSKDLKNGCVKAAGSDMYYVRFGHGKKKLIVLPGLSDGLATVRGKAFLLAGPYKKFFEQYTVYMFSRINGLPAKYSIKEMARDQAEALRNLGIEKTSVMGVSQGGMVAQYLAADFPDQVEKLVIAVSAPYANETIQNVVGSWIQMSRRKDHKTLMMDTAEKMYSDGYIKKYRSFFPLLGFVSKPKTYQRFFTNADAILGFDARDELSKITCPTFIIGGAADKTVGVEASYEMNKKIAGSRLYIYEEYGHALFEEAKDFYERVFNFLEEA